MIKNQCEIVKDLLPNYVEKTLSPGTNEFIESHIKGCNNCRKVLEDLAKEELADENDNDIKQDINYLKKYNKKMNILKIFVVLLILINILVLSYIWYLMYVHIKTNNVYTIINDACIKTYEVFNENNFSFEADYGNDVSTSFYFKDGKYKKVDYGKNKTRIPEVEQEIEYGIDADYRYEWIHFTIFKDGYIFKNAAFKLQNTILNNSDVSMYLDSFFDLGFNELSNLEVTNEFYNNKECYLIKNYKNTDKTQWEEMWIDKDTMLIIRERRIEPDNNFDYNYTWKIGNVTDEDIAISDTSRLDSYPFYNEVLDKLIATE